MSFKNVSRQQKFGQSCYVRRDSLELFSLLNPNSQILERSFLELVKRICVKSSLQHTFSKIVENEVKVTRDKECEGMQGKGRNLQKLKNLIPKNFIVSVFIKQELDELETKPTKIKSTTMTPKIISRTL